MNTFLRERKPLKNKRSSEGRFERLIRILTVITLITLTAICLGVLLLTFEARAQLASDQTQFCIVSTRQPAADALYSYYSSDKNGIKYLRPDSQLAIEVLQLSHTKLTKDELVVAKFKDYKYVSMVPTSVGLTEVGTRISQLQRASWASWAIYSVLIGLGVGLIVPSRKEWVLAEVLALALTSAVKLFMSCGTCARGEIFGFDAAFIGMTFFSALIALIFLPKSFRWLPLLPLTVAAVPFWQVASSLQVAFCIPCSLIALISSYLFASSISFDHNSNSRKLGSAFSRRFNFSWVLFALAPALASAAMLTSGSQGPSSSVALHRIRNIYVKNVSQLGLKPTGKRQIIFIAHYGCGPCQEALRELDSISPRGFTFAAIGLPDPDSIHIWEPIPNASMVSATPSVLFVLPNGGVEREVFGLSSNIEQVSKLFHQAEGFLARRWQSPRRRKL